MIIVVVFFILGGVFCYFDAFTIYVTAPAITQQIAALIFLLIGTVFFTSAAIISALDSIRVASKKAAPAPSEHKMAAALTPKSIHPNEIR